MTEEHTKGMVLRGKGVDDCSCVFCSTCRSFGVPTVPVKVLIKDLQPLFESKDVKARDKVKEIVVCATGWR
jgi:hypothetical protein